MNKENIDFNRKFMYRGEMIDLTDESMRRRQYNEAKNAVEAFKSKYPGLDSFDVTEDSNNNGKWDNGFYILHLQPEKTFYYNQTFQLRANWDLEVNWSVK